MFASFFGVGDPGDVRVHIYDLGPSFVGLNVVCKAIGTGAFHAGVEVFGKEWSFCPAPCGDYDTGVFWVPPKGCTGHVYRESLEMGRTNLSRTQVNNLLDELMHDWTCTKYDLLRRNCCHFSSEFCRRLGVGDLPKWVTSLAGVGAMLRSGMRLGPRHVPGQPAAPVAPVAKVPASGGGGAQRRAHSARSASPGYAAAAAGGAAQGRGARRRSLTPRSAAQAAGAAVAGAAKAAKGLYKRATTPGRRGVEDAEIADPLRCRASGPPAQEFGDGRALSYEISGPVPRSKASLPAQEEPAKGERLRDDPCAIPDVWSWLWPWEDAPTASRPSATSAGHRPAANPSGTFAPPERGHGAGQGPLRVGDEVEVFSNSAQAWCKGRVDSVEDSGQMVVSFLLPGQTERSAKSVPAGHPHVRRLPLAQALPSGGLLPSGALRDIRPGAQVEVWSNSAKVWCPGHVKDVSGSSVKVAFHLPGAKDEGLAEKEVHRGDIAQVLRFPAGEVKTEVKLEAASPWATAVYRQGDPLASHTWAVGTGDQIGCTILDGYVVGTWVEVFSNTFQEWGAGRITLATPTLIKVVFQMPGAADEDWHEKQLPRDSALVRLLGGHYADDASATTAGDRLRDRNR